jgi:hypothetical protein
MGRARSCHPRRPKFDPSTKGFFSSFGKGFLGVLKLNF